MKLNRVIKQNNLPTKAPFMSALVIYLCLDKWNATGWIWGVFGMLYFIILVNWIVKLIQDKEIDIFGNDKKIEKEIKDKVESTFRKD